MNKVSVAFIGMGYRGKQLFRLLRNIPFFQILAVADPGVEPSELPDISCYNHGENSSLEMLEKHHPELVFIASPCNIMCSTPCYVWSMDVMWLWRLRADSVWMSMPR